VYRHWQDALLQNCTHIHPEATHHSFFAWDDIYIGDHEIFDFNWCIVNKKKSYFIRSKVDTTGILIFFVNGSIEICTKINSVIRVITTHMQYVIHLQILISVSLLVVPNIKMHPNTTICFKIFNTKYNTNVDSASVMSMISITLVFSFQ
jgi:hypothetical protein